MGAAPICDGRGTYENNDTVTSGSASRRLTGNDTDVDDIDVEDMKQEFLAGQEKLNKVIATLRVCSICSHDSMQFNLYMFTLHIKSTYTCPYT